LFKNYLKIKKKNNNNKILEQKLVSKETEERTIEILQGMVSEDTVSRLEKLMIARLLSQEGYTDKAVEIFLSLKSFEEIRKLSKVIQSIYLT
jgi:hypothetical protein